jgi:hypothetical protein
MSKCGKIFFMKTGDAEEKVKQFNPVWKTNRNKL